ncbi:hypothetical protein E3N88_09470 [Mikania micrantha]|uniref:Uncharacterized protein n=1 Tax=Mikania micrantha TaxID=192012 RepID=A0A5N6PJ77_9ASTR|nr:hypothetical protein E3N88_09470 [Mikania micrantha]
MEDESIYSSCRGCGSPCHTRNECPEYQQFCEDVKQQIYELDYYHQDFFDDSYYPPSSDYQTGFILSADYNSKTQSSNNFEFFSVYKSEDEARIARLELRIYQIDEYLSAPNLSVQQQVHYLEMKCEFLNTKIQIEESISPLPEDIRSCWEEEVVEMNTTSNFSPNEESRVECLVVDDEIETILVLPNPPSKLIPLINKCGNDYLNTRINNVHVFFLNSFIIKCYAIKQWEFGYLGGHVVEQSMGLFVLCLVVSLVVYYMLCLGML